MQYSNIPGGVVVSIAAFHPAGPGSIPGVGELFFSFFSWSIDFFFKVQSIWFNQMDSFYTYF